MISKDRFSASNPPQVASGRTFLIIADSGFSIGERDLLAITAGK